MPHVADRGTSGAPRTKRRPPPNHDGAKTKQRAEDSHCCNIAACRVGTTCQHPKTSSCHMHKRPVRFPLNNAAWTRLYARVSKRQRRQQICDTPRAATFSLLRGGKGIMKNKSGLTCWCCSKYPHNRHFLHVALPEFRIADVQVFNGTCKVVVCGDDSHGKHDCRVR